MATTRRINFDARPNRIKILLFTVSTIAVLAGVAHITWKYTGTGKWEFHSDSDGVVIYKMKTPGVTLMKFKAISKVKTSLDQAVASMRDTGVESCSKWVPGCVSDVIIKQWDPVRLSEVHMWRVDLPAPLSPREFLLETRFTPEPSGKSVLIEFIATPDALPRKECCRRVEMMHNSWKFTALSKNEIQVISVQNMDIGLPYFMLNYIGPKSTRKLFGKLPGIFNDKKYKDVRYEFMRPVAK